MENYKNYKTMLATLKDLLENPSPRIAVALTLDFSGTMAGDPIKELKNGVNQFLDEIRNDDMTLNSAEISVVTFNDRAECVTDFTSADRVQPTFPIAYGCTHMGEGIRLTLDLLEKRKQDYKNTGVEYYQPIMVIMSDGMPNGDPKILQAQIQRIAELVAKRRLTVIAVGIGNHADMKTLAKLSPKTPPVRLNHLQFREFFSWLSASVSAVSASFPGDESAEPDMDALKALAAEPWPVGNL